MIIKDGITRKSPASRRGCRNISSQNSILGLPELIPTPRSEDSDIGTRLLGGGAGETPRTAQCCPGHRAELVCSFSPALTTIGRSVRRSRNTSTSWSWSGSGHSSQVNLGQDFNHDHHRQQSLSRRHHRCRYWRACLCYQSPSPRYSRDSSRAGTRDP